MATNHPIIRKHVWHLASSALTKTLENTNWLGLQRSCINCGNFDQKKELCKKAIPPSRPPARIIALACPAYEDIEDDIPF